MLRPPYTSDPAETEGFHTNILALGAGTSTEQVSYPSFAARVLYDDLVHFKYIAWHCQKPDFHHLHPMAYGLPA